VPSLVPSFTVAIIVDVRRMKSPPSAAAPLIFPHPVLPPEITDSIIHQLSENAEVLRTCSLVCRTWLPASRYILHWAISLRGEDISGFVDLIKSAENTYQTSLRAMELSLCENGPTASLLQLLPLFVCLESVRISSSIFHHNSPALPRVRTLDLFDLRFRTFAAFTDLTTQFPNLKNLSFEAISWGYEGGWKPPGEDKHPPNSLPQLKLDTFTADITNDSQMREWLLCSRPLTSQLSLLLPKSHEYGRNALSASTLTLVSEYLHHLNVHLKHLYLRSGSDTEVTSLRRPGI
jgi:hypothetical protein